MKGIQRLADAMLARFVPETKAAAINCSTEGIGTCVIRYCCWGSEIPGGKWCGPYEYVC